MRNTRQNLIVNLQKLKYDVVELCELGIDLGLGSSNKYLPCCLTRGGSDGKLGVEASIYLLKAFKLRVRGGGGGVTSPGNFMKLVDGGNYKEVGVYLNLSSLNLSSKGAEVCPLLEEGVEGLSVIFVEVVPEDNSLTSVVVPPLVMIFFEGGGKKVLG